MLWFKSALWFVAGTCLDFGLTLPVKINPSEHWYEDSSQTGMSDVFPVRRKNSMLPPARKTLFEKGKQPGAFLDSHYEPGGNNWSVTQFLAVFVCA